MSVGAISPPRTHAQLLSLPVVVSAACLVAAALGYAIATGSWIVVIAAAALPIVVMLPVPAALGLFAFLVPFDSVSVLGHSDVGATLTFVAGGIAAALLLAVGLAGRRFKAPPRSAFWWTALILWGAATSLWALDSDLSLSRLPTAFSLLVLFLITVSLRITRTELMWTVVAAVIGGVCAALYATSSYYGGTSFESGMRGSLIVGGRSTDPNYFAASLLLPISMAVGVFLSVRSWTAKAFSLIAAATMVFAVLLTMSRGALLSLVVIVLIYCYRLRVNWRVLVIPAVFAVLLALMPNFFFARLAGSGADEGAGRLEIWRVGLVLVQNYGLLGAGLDNFPVGYQQFSGMAKVFPYQGYARGAHNTYLNMMVESGVVGMMLFLGGLGAQFRAARKRAAAAASLLPPLVSFEAACWGVITAGIFLDLFWWKLFWFAWMLLALASHSVDSLPEHEAEAWSGR